MFDPIPQTPRYRLVAEALIARIEDGSLPAGKKLPPDRVLVESLGVSRATLREALIALEVMGHIETRFGAGAFVTEATPEQTPTEAPDAPLETAGMAHGPFETLEARRLIEGELAALAAEQTTPAQLDKLWDAVHRMETASRWDAQADEAFHATIAEAAGNAVLAGLAARFWGGRTQDPLWSFLEDSVEDANRRPALVAKHEAIIEALTEGDADAAREAMHRHLDSFAETLLDTLDSPSQESAEAIAYRRLQTGCRSTA
ncbi:FadR/GntR family transcriptional regulator [Tropicimonas sp. S265A]|uniref:FadR/GntR family transcriptional regulator n=1 Tax=Tropicimonas sp. S265A TaxID=3415134 RepID=UPI003C7D2842